MKSAIIKISGFILKGLRIFLKIYIVVLLIAFLTQFVDEIDKYPTLVKLNNIAHYLTNPFVEQIKLAMPYKYHGINYSLVILIVLTLILLNVLMLAKKRLSRFEQNIKDKRNYYDWRKQATHVLSQDKIAEMDSKFEALSAGKVKSSDRKQILKEFAMLKSQLDSMGQQLAFLAIDVADSTGMKRDEDKYIAAYDFDRYNELVNQSLKENGVIKFAMTPDGIMSCFRTVDDAVNAAKALLDKLKVFNAEEKKMKQDFEIRCGINAGFVYMDDDTPLEQVSDRVIDIAGHMQKYAKPNCINIAASAIEPLKTRSGFDETADVIDEQKVFQWSTTK